MTDPEGLVSQCAHARDGVGLVAALSSRQNAQNGRGRNKLTTVDGPLGDYIKIEWEVSSDNDSTTSFYARYSAGFNVLLGAFLAQDAAWLVPVIRHASSNLVRWAFFNEEQARNGQDVSDAARLLNKGLTISSGDRLTGNAASFRDSKRAVVLHLANLSFKCYFYLHKIRLCETVIKNAQNSSIEMEACPRADRVTYQYFLGRIYLFQHRMRKAYEELYSAFVLCTDRHWKNRRQILSYLAVAGLILGIYPSQTLLQHFRLDDLYVPLIAALDRGDYANTMQYLEKHRLYHLRRGTYLVLREKLPVISWRHLFRQALLITRAEATQESTPTLSITSLVSALQWTMRDDALDEIDVECIASSLIDQGYIKAYIFHAKGLIVFQKGPLLGFPPVHLVDAIPG